MASPHGLFYAYAKHSTTDWAWRFLIVFESRSVADEWWRAVSASVESGYRRFAGVTRISPQWYTHNPDVDAGNIRDTLTDDKCAKKFLGKVIFTLLDDRDAPRFAIAPPLNCTDYKSGNVFFIRSLVQPNLFWYYDPISGQLCASATRRTSFIIRIVAGKDKDGTVMIGEDKVSIGVVFNQLEVSVGFSSRAGSRALIAGGEVSSEFFFSDFDGGFGVLYESPFDAGPNHQENMLITKVEMGGERWELVA